MKDNWSIFSLNFTLYVGNFGLFENRWTRGIWKINTDKTYCNCHLCCHSELKEQVYRYHKWWLSLIPLLLPLSLSISWWPTYKVLQSIKKKKVGEFVHLDWLRTNFFLNKGGGGGRGGSEGGKHLNKRQRHKSDNPQCQM